MGYWVCCSVTSSSFGGVCVTEREAGKVAAGLSILFFVVSGARCLRLLALSQSALPLGGQLHIIYRAITHQLRRLILSTRETQRWPVN